MTDVKMVSLGDLPEGERAEVLVNTLRALFDEMVISTPVGNELDRGSLGCVRLLCVVHRWAEDSGCTKEHLQYLWQQSTEVIKNLDAMHKKGVS